MPDQKCWRRGFRLISCLYPPKSLIMTIFCPPGFPKIHRRDIQSQGAEGDFAASEQPMGDAVLQRQDSAGGLCCGAAQPHVAQKESARRSLAARARDTEEEVGGREWGICGEEEQGRH